MTSTFSRRQQDRPLAPSYLLWIAVLLLVPVLAIARFEQQSREEAAREYGSNRDSVLNSIGQAAAAQDLSALRKIHKRFSAAVNDSQFRILLDRAMAEVTAKEAEVELNIAKHLDLARHREESSMRASQVFAPADLEVDGQRLSVLPQ